MCSKFVIFENLHSDFYFCIPSMEICQPKYINQTIRSKYTNNVLELIELMLMRTSNL